MPTPHPTPPPHRLPGVPLVMCVEAGVATFDFGRYAVRLATAVTVTGPHGPEIVLPRADLDLALRLAHAGSLRARRADPFRTGPRVAAGSR